jgi:hypothetical protein
MPLFVDTGLGCNDDVRGQPLLEDQYEIDIELIDWQHWRESEWARIWWRWLQKWYRFTWMEHFTLFVFTPALLLFDFNSFLMLCDGHELDNFQNIFDALFICSRIDLLGNISGMRYVAITILFFVTSLYIYKISLPEIAPRIIYTCAMLTRQEQQEQSNGCCLSTFHLGILLLPEIVIWIVLILLSIGTADGAVLIMSMTTSLFSFFGILASFYVILL